MNNKQLINKLKNNAELAMASYGYFDLIGKKFDNKRNKIEIKRTITLHDILDSTYANYETQDSSFFNPLKLKGDFTPTQAKNFFEHYDLLEHCPNTNSGFSATLFKDKRTKEYIFSIRGTEINDMRII